MLYLALRALLMQVFPDAALVRVRQHLVALPQQPLRVLLRRLQGPQAVIAGWGREDRPSGSRKESPRDPQLVQTSLAPVTAAETS